MDNPAEKKWKTKTVLRNSLLFRENPVDRLLLFSNHRWICRAEKQPVESRLVQGIGNGHSRK